MALRFWKRQTRPAAIDFGDLRRLSPVSREFGFDRGQPIDRYYIERFLGRWSADVRGRVLECGDDTYTRQFGGDRVDTAEVFHAVDAHPGATFVGDLTRADHLPSDRFDCFILTQTLQLIYDVPAALATVKRILKPGGVLLLTIPGISQLSDHEWRNSWYWNFTTVSARRLCGDIFGPDNIVVEARGNVLAATSFLQGIAAEELETTELDHQDNDYQLLVTVRAVKTSDGEGTGS